MAFSAILGLAGNLYAANKASQQAKDAQALQMYQMQQQQQAPPPVQGAPEKLTINTAA